jgi:hypothetical protein
MVFPAPSETRLTELGLLFTHLSSRSFELIAGRRKFLENGFLKTDSTLPHVLGLFSWRSSSPGELHPEALTEPCLSLSTHTARAIH